MSVATACYLCGSPRLLSLPSPWPDSMTTAGLKVPEPLAKVHCAECGLLQRVEIRHLGSTDFYEKHYSFYERPGAATYDLSRYQAMADWIYSALDGYRPQTALDAGCGRGWMMDALRGRLPETHFQGVEPSEQESTNACSLGFPVIAAKFDRLLNLAGRYDLVYSTNVVEHTSDPVDFIKSLGHWLSDNGLAIIVCPDATQPSAEFMFSDQNFSFAPEQLMRLAVAAGLEVVAWHASPDVASLQDKQLLVLARPGAHKTRQALARHEPFTPDSLFTARCRYVESYLECDQYLQHAVKDARRVLNFGTSTWSMLLSAYCPSYWERVTACVIDGGAGSFQGKPVLDAATELQPGNGDVVVLGVNPFSQCSFADRLAQRGVISIRWDHLVCH